MHGDEDDDNIVVAVPNPAEVSKISCGRPGCASRYCRHCGKCITKSHPTHCECRSATSIDEIVRLNCGFTGCKRKHCDVCGRRICSHDNSCECDRERETTRDPYPLRGIVQDWKECEVDDEDDSGMGVRGGNISKKDLAADLKSLDRFMGMTEGNLRKSFIRLEEQQRTSTKEIDEKTMKVIVTLGERLFAQFARKVYPLANDHDCLWDKVIHFSSTTYEAKIMELLGKVQKGSELKFLLEGLLCSINSFKRVMSMKQVYSTYKVEVVHESDDDKLDSGFAVKLDNKDYCMAKSRLLFLSEYGHFEVRCVGLFFLIYHLQHAL
jgi:hypothetical protein